jgi:hypothetical protein
MNTKAKATLIIIVTLVIGVIIGSMLTRAYVIYKVKKIIPFRREPDNFISHIEEIIQPTAEQQEQIREILEKHAKRTLEIHKKHLKEIQSSIESLNAELDPILTTEQKKRLKERFQRYPRFREGFPPPPPPRKPPFHRRRER